MATETASTKAKKKTQLSREDHVSSKVGFFKFCYLLFLVNNYKTVILNIEIIFCKTVLLSLLVELELELETKVTIWSRDRDQHLRFGAAFDVSFGVLEVHCTGALTALFMWYAYFFSSFSFLLVVYII